MHMWNYACSEVCKTVFYFIIRELKPWAFRSELKRNVVVELKTWANPFYPFHECIGCLGQKDQIEKTQKLTQNIKILRRRKNLLRAARMTRNFYHIPSLVLSQPASQKHHINGPNVKFKTTALVHGPEQVLGTTWGEKILVISHERLSYRDSRYAW